LVQLHSLIIYLLLLQLMQQKDSLSFRDAAAELELKKDIFLVELLQILKNKLK